MRMFRKGLNTYGTKKAKTLIREDDETPESIYDKAGIYAEFGKIVCISIGIVHTIEGGKKEARFKSFYSHDEKELLKEFCDMLNNKFNSPSWLMCAHNGKEFDFPFMARRILINGMRLPEILNMAGKKPWEILHIDTMQLWKFGDFKSFTSLELLTALFDIPTPKDDITGADVGRVYYEEDDLDRIAIYCEKDVLAIVQLMLRLQGKPLVEEENVKFSDF